MVPDLRNEFFIGRDAFLKTLRRKFQGTYSPDTRYQGRIALFGMGGIGKTQIALEFIYRSRASASYSRIYWISAVTQESLLDGYEKIAKLAKIPMPRDSKPIDAAEQVLSWLKITPSWLLVLDNLDDITNLSTRNLGKSNIVSVLLPETGPGQHILITTRNPHVPAQGLEVPLFKERDSIALLSSLSEIQVCPGSEEYMVAQRIAKELGNLPLAISQAGPFIKLKSDRSFSKFIEQYAESRSRVNAWVPQGPRSYPHSVATTWIMSFNEIRTNNPIAEGLFHLLAFLNADGILIGFLKSGAESMDEDLQRLLLNEFEFSEALLTFETFSLIKWDRKTAVSGFIDSCKPSSKMKCQIRI